MRFRPCIDLHQGKVKQIVGGSLSDADSEKLITNFESPRSPAHFASMYCDDKLYGGHVIMLGPGNEHAASEAIAAFPEGFQVGGGINAENAMRYLDIGASHVIVTSYVFFGGHIQWERLEELVRALGKKRIVLDLSCRKKGDSYVIVTDRWQVLTSQTINAQLLEKLGSYCDEFLIHAADIEGLKGGVDQELIALLGEISPLNVTYAGGIRSIQDLEITKELGKSRVDATIGSALDIFGGTLPYKEVVQWHNRQQNKEQA
ncbi:phosphoribosylformimino-5-aminoimidazole carboxamide ribotide isomerase [Chitinispirillales bacterium ANBcel5]|uniref:phosphoribosylformimino-5-aminoimidazole carboxamide ribotide isomerase n=1 Tax=Cellulosispirillum alkaliphilum TaxID=3039283 RepID=UPI002A548F21|nr:phosphoribosylformimino-5-aminoimidazole carboxamide ribotide isomerase [Chitinispirillales bacterium ANBcel5]